MRTLVHLSDLHFGRIDPALLGPLAQRVEALHPQLVIVSGDLTQRARPEEFRQARRFLDSLPGPQIVVPGNHDVPLYNLFQRVFQPLRKFRRIVASDLEPAYVDEEMAVIGVNTARALVFKGGRINAAQIESVREKLCGLPEHVIRVLVTHHPFDLPAGADARDIVGRAGKAMAVFARCGADLLLSGHLHASHAGKVTERYRIEGYAALIVQAGTATSTRGRGEANAFNVLRLTDRSRVEIERHLWDEAARDYLAQKPEAFERGRAGWKEAERAVTAGRARPSPA